MQHVFRCFGEISKQVFSGMLLAAACSFSGVANAGGNGPPPPPPALKTCPDGARIAVAATCRLIPFVGQAGATEATLTGAIVTLGTTVGDMISGAFGGATGTAATGINRTALSGQSGQAAAPGGLKWNVWGALARVNAGYSFQPVQSGGNADLLLGGIDYSLANNVVLGVALSGERTRIGTSYNGGNVSGNGNTIAPYLGWRINNAWLLDATLGFGNTNLTSTDNSIPGGTNGSNKATRSMGTLGLAYNQGMGNWLLTGKGSLLTVENKYSAFTFSNGQFVPGSTTRTSQMRLGGQAAYNAGAVVPFFGVTYIYDIERANQNPIAGQSAANDRDAFQLRVGLNFRSSGALYGGIVLSSEVGRSQFKNDQILLNVGMRF